MTKPIYVVMENIDGEWVPAVGGGSSTTPNIRAFDNLNSAKKSMARLNHLRGLKQVETERRIARFEEVTD